MKNIVISHFFNFVVLHLLSRKKMGISQLPNAPTEAKKHRKLPTTKLNVHNTP